MVAELGHLSRMWNLNGSSHHLAAAKDDDDSWEVRDFAEDTNNALGTTWPPRSYTCTFCFREFRSAQALGGHMNVHRRDRARLRLYSQGFEPSQSSSTVPQKFFPSPDVRAGARFGLSNPVFSDYVLNLTKFSSTSMYIKPSGNQSVTHNFLSGMVGSPLVADVPEVCIPVGVVVDEMDLELRLGR